MQRPTDIPAGLCQCGCGERTPLAVRTNKHRGLIRGEPVHFIVGHHQTFNRGRTFERIRTPDEVRFWRMVQSCGHEPACIYCCWEWQGARLTSGGYGHFNPRLLPLPTRSHCVAYVLWNNRSIPKELWCLHHCHNPLCCNPAHVYLGTAAQNTRDMMVARRDAHSTLIPEQVARIRALWRDGMHCNAIAKEFPGVAYTIICNVASAKTYRHLPHEPRIVIPKKVVPDSPFKKGSQHPSAKLKEADIPVIRSLYPAMQMKEIAQWYSVNPTTIEHIIHRRTWRHV